MKHYDILLPVPDHKDPDKTHWPKVGVAFPLKNSDGFKLIIYPGLAISGEAVAMKHIPKKEE